MEMFKNPGEIILRKGDITPVLFFIAKGSVRIETDTENPFFLKENDFFGEEGVFLRKPSNYTAIVSEIADIRFIQRDEVSDFFKAKEDRILKLIKKSVAKTFDSIDDLTKTSPNYLFFLDKVIEHSNFSSNKDEVSLDISLLTLAEEMSTSLPVLRTFISESENFGHFIFKDNKLIVKNINTVKDFVSQSFLNLFVQDNLQGKDGLGNFNLINKYFESRV